MNQGVEILLARMDSNPDEFVGVEWPNKSRWDWVMDELRNRIIPTKEGQERGHVPLRFLSDEEVNALWDKLESLRADQFTNRVMETLLRDEDFNPFEDAMRAGIGKLAQYQHQQDKPTKIAMSPSQLKVAQRIMGGSK